MSPRVAVVVIGRNPGPRLEAAVRSARAAAGRVVYVDSGSTDGSPRRARALGAEVVELEAGRPFTAARARNAGLERLAATGAPPELVQFLDGDCELARGWIARAAAELDRRPAAALVTGRLRELRRDETLYHRWRDLEGDPPAAAPARCGGVFLARAEALRAVGGFDPAIAAGEEPELCRRLERHGREIRRLDVAMATHDAGPLGFADWWRRSLRAGRGDLATALRPGDRYGARLSLSAALWAAALPTAIAAAAYLWGPLALAGAALFPAQAARIALRRRRRGTGWTDSVLYGLSCMAEKPPRLVGALGHLAARARGLEILAPLERPSRSLPEAESRPR